MTADEEKICSLEKDIVALKKELEGTARALVLAANTGRANIALVLSAVVLILTMIQMFRSH
jgi:hypothetical protein